MGLSLRSLWLRTKRRPRRLGAGDALNRSRPCVELLEERSLLSITFSGPNNSGTATLTGTATADQFVIRLDQIGSGNIDFSDNNGQSFTMAALSGITDVQVQGLGGTDRLILDFSNGIFGKTTSAFPITFDGGSGFDRLIVQPGLPSGQGTITESFFSGANFGDGELAISNGQLTTGVSMTHVEHVIDELPATSLRVFGTDRNNVIDIGFGESSSGGVTTNTVRGLDLRAIDLNGAQRNDEGFAGDPAITDPDPPTPSGDPVDDNAFALGQSRGFIPITFANKGALVIDSQGGDDLIIVDISQAATGLTSLTLDGNTGTDVASLLRVPGSLSVTQQNIEQSLTTTAATYVNFLYETRLGRLPEAGAVPAWVNFLNSSGIQATASAIELSPEARERFVTHLYENVLGRDPMGGEELGWVNFLLGGGSETDVLQGFLSSPEFFNRAQTLISSGTADERFVAALYQTALGRVASSGEVSAWAAAVPSLGRPSVVNTFIMSPEFRNNLVHTLYVMVLHRFPDQAGFLSWVNSSLSLTDIRIDILGSGESFFRN
jgi:hypothetical protein